MSTTESSYINNSGDMPLLTASSSYSMQELISSSLSTPPSTTATSPPVASTANSYEYNYATPPTVTAAAAAALCFTPTDNDINEWEDFCSHVGVTPPKSINMALGRVKEASNVILRNSHITCPSSGSCNTYEWDSLNKLQQAGMAFIINEGILDCFPAGQDKNRWVAHGVLGIDKADEKGETIIHGEAIWKALSSFIRKGGDDITLTGSSITNHGAESHRKFLRSNHQGLWAKVHPRNVKSCTIFSLNNHVEPILKFQTHFSMVCAFVVSSLMIHYRQVIHPQVAAGAPTSGATSAWSGIAAKKSHESNGLSRLITLSGRRKKHDNSRSHRGRGSPSVGPPVALSASDDGYVETKAGHYMLNIGRYMRNNLTAHQKYESIFLGFGFVFEEVFDALLKQSNIASKDFRGCIYITQQESPKSIYKAVKKELQHGALCCRIKMYEGYGDKDICVKEPGMKFLDAYHFVTIVGVSFTNKKQHGGIMFLVQDSFAGHPFKSISLELLREMKSTKRLYYILNDDDIKMPNGSIFDMKAEDVATAGGLKLRRTEGSRGPLTEEEKNEHKKNQELLKALVLRDYVPEWVRARRMKRSDDNDLNNNAGVVHVDADEEDVVKDDGFEVEYEK